MGGDLVPGAYRSEHLLNWRYAGYIKARIRMPLGSKVWPAFWTVQESLQWGAEFDIGEYFGTAFHKACMQTNSTNIRGSVELLHKASSLPDCCKKANNAAG